VINSMTVGKWSQ